MKRTSHLYDHTIFIEPEKKSLTGHKTVSICGFPYPCTCDKPVGVEGGGILMQSWQTGLIIFNTVGVLMLSDHLHSYDNQLILSKKNKY